MVWLCGCAAVLFYWWRRCWGVALTVRATSPRSSGREFEVLLRVKHHLAVAQHIELVISEARLEPGILGIFRAILFLPAGISERLTDAELEAVIAHELCHVCRRDNFTSALHMLAESVFWFHPLVWWIGARLVDERKRACDEEVLREGSDPQVYAESILKVCEFYVESPLFCTAGVTGSNLKKRIEVIMANRSAHKLGLGKKILLTATGLLAFAGPIIIGFAKPASRGQAQTQNTPLAPAYEVVSIKLNKSGEAWKSLFFRPNGFTAKNQTLQALIQAAYGVQGFQISGEPEWLNSAKFDIDAKIDKLVVDDLSKFNEEQRLAVRTRMLQALLAEKFKLTLHSETKELPIYTLVLANNGVTLHQATPGDTYTNGVKALEGQPLGAHRMMGGNGELTMQALPIGSLTKVLAEQLGRIVTDKTGLKGDYDFTLHWTQASPDSILVALTGQLGLQLNPQTGPVEVLVIDHAEEFADNETGQNQPQTRGAESQVAGRLDSRGYEPPAARVYKVVSVEPNESDTAMTTPTWAFASDGFVATNVTLQTLIECAYGVEDHQISGGPNWLNRQRYDVEAKVDRSFADELSKLDEGRRAARQQPMLLELLADRFRLEVHRETREVPVYVIFTAGTGANFQASKPGGSPEMRFARGQITGRSMPVSALDHGRASLARALSFYLQRPVLDKTSLTGVYDFSLHWTPDDTRGLEQGPSIFAAIQEQLGLRLLPSNDETAPVKLLIVDHAEHVRGS